MAKRHNRRHPAEDFNTSSQLIVNESQEAIFFRDGQALDTFGPGRHTLKTKNIPFPRRIINLPTGGASAFHCRPTSSPRRWSGLRWARGGA